MRPLVISCIFLCFLFMNLSGQKARIYHEALNLPVCNIHLKSLTEMQKVALDSITYATIVALKPLNQKLTNFHKLKNYSGMEELDQTSINDSIGEIESRITKAVYDHKRKLRDQLNFDQKQVFDRNYTDFLNRYHKAHMPLVAINELLPAEYKARKNAIKTNIMSYPFKNVNLTYQRRLSERWTLDLSLSGMSRSRTPFITSLYSKILGSKVTEEDLNQEVNNPVANLRSEGYTISLFARYYFPYMRSPSGNITSSFYVGPYTYTGKYRHASHFRAEFLGTFFYVDGSLDFTSVGAGFHIGNEWVINRRWVIDFTIFGINYKSSKVSGTFSTSSTGINLYDYLEEKFDIDLSELKDLEFTPITDFKVEASKSKFKSGVLVSLRVGIMF